MLKIKNKNFIFQHYEIQYTSHKNNCRAKWSRAQLSQNARAIFSGSCFCGYYITSAITLKSTNKYFIQTTIIPYMDLVCRIYIKLSSQPQLLGPIIIYYHTLKESQGCSILVQSLFRGSCSGTLIEQTLHYLSISQPTS